MNEKILTAFSKLINSDVIKNIYPMVDHIDVKSMEWIENPYSETGYFHRQKPGYLINIDIVVDSPDMTHENMYDFEFDPHYLADHHIESLSKYLGIDIKGVIWSVHNIDGELISDSENLD
jgi:hypothetical protein